MSSRLLLTSLKLSINLKFLTKIFGHPRKTTSHDDHVIRRKFYNLQEAPAISFLWIQRVEGFSNHIYIYKSKTYIRQEDQS